MIFSGGVIGGARPAQGVTFGSGAYMLRGALAGVGDGYTGVISFWFKVPSSGVFRELFAGSPDLTSNGAVYARLGNTGWVNMVCKSTDRNTTRVSIATNYAQSNGVNEWYHIVASWNSGTGNRLMYVNGASAAGASTGTNGIIRYNNAYWALGKQLDNTDYFGPGASMAEFFFAPNQFIDLTVASNREKFLRPNGKPAFLGRNGEKPLGVSPSIYLTGPASTFGTNYGTGGDFTPYGTFTDEGSAVTL